MFTVRESEPEDLPAILAVHEQAFGRPDEARLVARLIADGYAALSLVAERKGGIIGHILFPRLTLLFDDRSVRALALSPVSVRADVRRQGIAAVLVRDGLRRALEAGWEACFVLGDPDYYRRFGFTQEAARRIAAPFAGPAFMGLALVPGALTGTGGRLIYPPPFAALSAA